MTKNLLLGLLSLPFVFLSCKSGPEEKEEMKAESAEENTAFQPIQELFEESTFSSGSEMELLKELSICTLDSSKLNQEGMSYCSAENYKFFPLRKDLSLKNGFILLIKAGTGGFPLRRLIIFQRERGKLVKVNGFVANLIGRLPSASGFDDLLLRFNDKDGQEDMFYNCLFTWDKAQYQYKQVDVIEGANWGGKVKAEFKDSISKEIYQNIVNNQMIF